jgi:hypothetical protein
MYNLHAAITLDQNDDDTCFTTLNAANGSKLYKQ